MKKKCFLLLTTLSLLAGLALPAGAMETATPDGESWRVDREVFKERFVNDYVEAHPEEVATFDPEGWFLERNGDWTTVEKYKADREMDDAAFRQECWTESLNGAAEGAYNAYIVEEFEKTYPGELDEKGIGWALMIYQGGGTLEERAADLEKYDGYTGGVEGVRRDLAAFYVMARSGVAYRHERTLEYRSQYPGSYENYDPDKGYEGYWAHQKQIAIDRYCLQNEVEWKEWKYVLYMTEDYPREQEQAAKRQEYPQRWPEEYAAFDPYAWFAGYYHDWTLEGYMETMGVDAEGFKTEMFLQWADKDPTGFFNGCCVTVNGTPIQFQLYRDLDGEVTGPKVENDRILIPLRAAAEKLGLTVEWKPETNQVICSNEQKTITFTLGSLEYSGGALDAAPFAEKGITYLPLRALGETLGCKVEWMPDFATAALRSK